MADHGIDTTDQLLYFNSDRWWQSAKEALAIGKTIGDKVIIMSTSTGGTMAVLLAAEFPDQVHALLNMSPNMAINNPTAFLLNDPWGLQIARLVLGGKSTDFKFDSVRSKYWNGSYRLEALIELEEMLESKMNNQTFRKVIQPSLTLYYYKNEQEQDPQVKVSAMVEMNKLFSTPDSLKEIIAMPKTGGHVMGSSLVSKDIEGVFNEMEKFAIEKLRMKKVE